MFDRFLDFLKELPGNGLRERGEKFSDDDPRLAAAALMFHIMDADGDVREVERAKLSAMLSQKYGLKGDALKQLIRAAEEADQESISLSDFTSVLKRHLDYQARLDFIVLMWNIVYADGVASEVEADVMWRVADLIGIKAQDRDQIEAQVHAGNKAVPKALPKE
ncbi:tellurite resistance TerB family protein [Brucella thiophenivorans]|uniref:Tellurite resistance TerB family protein n=1 Tax=Brucella thiophenivorans TaxID=571255 RepID=A0A256G0P8_9HYPH|nr:TerB family tellurite resistance protein [Brucella thiophenivorans]OYR20673.1 tellurite resistance TerB family protein [Brucella thiophenivorans]